MAINDRVFDNGLATARTEATHLHICSSDPANYAAVAAAILATKAAPTINVPEAYSPSGRKIVIPAQSMGNALASGTATHWVLVDATNSRIIASGPTTPNQVLTSGNPVATGVDAEIRIRGLT